jgi:hypothetical protein
MELRGAISRSANRSFDHVVAEIGFSTISTFSLGTSQATETKLKCRKGTKRCPIQSSNLWLGLRILERLKIDTRQYS